MQDGLRRDEDAYDQAVDEPPHLGDGERDQLAELNHEVPLFPAAPGSRERTTAR